MRPGRGDGLQARIHPRPLTRPDELAAQLQPGAGAPSLLDVRWQLGGPPGREDYLAGHIPGAAYVDLETELAGPAGPGGRHPLPETADFEAAMRRAGVSHGRAVVVYDAATSMAAARAWWLLRYFGHSDVRVLDGGLRAWVAAGGALAAGAGAAPAGGDFDAVPGGMPMLGAHAAARVAEQGVLLDARAGERFRGEAEPVDPVAGHIPGAANLPGSELVDESGRFRDDGALRARFHAAGVHSEGQLGAYCGSGVSAAHEVLALELAGYRAALYVGSWSEWITDPGRPVARGPH